MNAIPPQEPDILHLPMPVLDRLMPMHLVVSASGEIRHVGPTLDKLAPGGLQGRNFFQAFDLRRPRSAAGLRELARAAGRLKLSLRDAGRTGLKGQAAMLPGGDVILFLSFGISVVDAVTSHGLTAADFAPTDLAIEMLYLVEAQSAVMSESQRLNDRLKEARKEAEARALSDALTGLGNRRLMDESLTRMLARGEDFGLLHLDLDHFKEVNDTMGHAAGDRVLEAVAEVLSEATRSGDVVARIGGDEFVVLARDSTDRGTLVDLGERIIAGLERPVPFRGGACRISGSVGVTSTAFYRRPDADRMLSDADEALYASKRGGRGTVRVASVARRRDDPE